MRMRRHPAGTPNAGDWAIYSNHLFPAVLKASISNLSKKYFVTKNEGTGIEIVSEHDTWNTAELAWLGMVNHSDATPFLGIGRPTEVQINPITYTIKAGVRARFLT